MTLEQEKYLIDYYGIHRSIYLNGKTARIVFNAYLYDDLDIEYIKEYDSETEAVNEINAYISSTNFMKERIGYSKESIDNVNDNIFKFANDALASKVGLPNEYVYKGNLDELKEGLKIGRSEYVRYR